MSTLASTEIGLAVQLLIEIIDLVDEKVNKIEKKIEELVEGDKKAVNIKIPCYFIQGKRSI